ncbi:unnamed protein product [Clonostachys solani]|uniref:Carboxylic ester hydrolase n=1 Tax=Clonostachys solani TaxID=160281 RepID=A0A9P0EQ31_9HYPO|nr:unnamed protein product [Clonostachys solani]
MRVSKNLLVASILTGQSLATKMSACSPESFSFPNILGTELHSINASLVRGYKGFVAFGRPEAALIEPGGVDFCNVTVSYKHPAHEDLVSVHVWLPTAKYNERLVDLGGGGWAAGEVGAEVMTGLASQGYAVASTDGGYFHNHFGTADPWLMKSPGNLDYPLIVNFAHRSLHELAIISKHIVAQGYGAKAKFAYWHGCSTGGRQGLTIANKYPEDFDGILASCPGVDYPSLVLSLYWPQFVMNQRNVYPHACEFEFLARAVTEACDGLDGDVDGVVARLDPCHFDLQSLAGKIVDCNGKPIQVSQDTLEVYKAILKGPVDPQGNELVGGATPGANLVGFLGTANAVCDENNNCARGRPFTIATDWIRLMLKKDPQFDPAKLTHEEYARMFRDARLEWGHLFGSSEPDMERFRMLGKKMLAWHGMNDQVIPLSHMRGHFDKVLAADNLHGITTSDYYRYFEVPGASHCGAPDGVAYPMHALETLRLWVEEGITPEELPTVVLGSEGNRARTPICAYPKVANWENGSFTCRVSGGQPDNSSEHHKDEL